MRSTLRLWPMCQRGFERLQPRRRIQTWIHLALCTWIEPETVCGSYFHPSSAEHAIIELCSSGNETYR